MTGTIVLVVPCPKDNAGMITQLGNHRDDFCFQCFGKVITLGIHGAAHREILPYHQSILIAEIIEQMVLIDITSPTTQHIAIEVNRHINGILYQTLVSAVQGIQRHPIGTTHKDGNLVHIETELARLVGQDDVISLQTDRADSYSAIIRIQDVPILIRQVDMSIIECCLTITMRPP